MGLRVANLLSEKALEAGSPFVPAAGSFAPSSEGVEAPIAAAAPAEGSSAQSTAPAAASIPDPAELKAAITTKFKELVASGTPPNEAATLAIKLVKEEAAQKAKEEAEKAAAAAVAANAPPASDRPLDLS